MRLYGKVASVIVGFCIFVSVTIGCSKRVSYPEQPILDSAWVSTRWIKSANDTLVIWVSFTDGNGDIGRPPEDTTKDAWITDTRTGYSYAFAIPMLDPDAGYWGVRGTLQFSLINLLICRPFREVDTTELLIRIRDRAGNLSNEVNTGPVYILCN